MNEKTNFAARAGRWSAAHWKTAFLGWFVLCVAVFIAGMASNVTSLRSADTDSGQTQKADNILEHDFPARAAESVLVQSKTQTIANPRFRAAVADVVHTLSGLSRVQNVHSPLRANGHSQISKDRRSALVQFQLRGDPDKAVDKVQPIIDAVAAAQARHPAYTVAEFGSASANHTVNKTLRKDLQRAEFSSLAVTLVILLLAFGALVAAGLPLLLGYAGFLATLGLNALASHLLPSGPTTPQVILLIGLALSVDYSLFYIRREREERAAGLSRHDALLKTAATSGQAVFISGLTVIVAMAGMLFTGNAMFTSLAVGAMLMVAVALIGSLSVLPALLSKLGDRVNSGRAPFLGRRRDRESRIWGFVLDRVLRRPALAAVLSGGALLALAAPALHMRTQLPSFNDLPRSLPVVRTYDTTQRAFPGAQTPAIVVVHATDVTAAPVQRALATLKQKALTSGQMTEPIQTDTNRAHTVETVSIPLKGNGTDAASQAALATLRHTLVPTTVGTLPGIETAVTGQTAGTHDFNQQMKSHAPLVFGFVLLLSFLLLLLMFRSIVIPLKAVVLNLLSVGAAYGMLVLVFQHHWAEGILGFHSNGAIASWLPLFLFVILFGLSMDYHVFILSRVKELVDGGMSTEQAVTMGIKRTASTVTCAAIVMVAIFSMFITLRTLELKQAGFGLAAAVLIDATVIRAVLLPAAMKLLGDWNWYLPNWLNWLPRLEHGSSVEPSASTAPLALPRAVPQPTDA